MAPIAKVIADGGAAPRDLTGIVVGVGPGPYTGLRVGVVTARVLGAALGIPVYGVCTLDVIAADVVSGGRDGEAGRPAGDFLVATDARRRELYWARYDASGARTDGPQVSAFAEIPAPTACGWRGADALSRAATRRARSGLPGGRAATLCRVAVAAIATGAIPARTLLPPNPTRRRPDAREPARCGSG